MKSCIGRIGRFAAVVSVIALAATWAGQAQAANVYWDINGATAGAGGVSPNGT